MRKFPPYSEQIAHIMKEFDFVKVHRHMKLTNWIWVGHGVPSLSSIKEVALILLVSVGDRDCRNGSTLSTGGFVARLERYSKTGNGMLSLDFTVSSYSYGEEEA